MYAEKELYIDTLLNQSLATITCISCSKYINSTTAWDRVHVAILPYPIQFLLK